MQTAGKYLSSLVCVLALAGCGGLELMPTPNIYVDTEFNPFADVPEALQGNTVDVLYVTDRSPETDKEGKLGYGYGRSYSMAYGSAIVQFGDEETTWDDVVAASRTSRRQKSMDVSVEEVTEKGRFPETPYPLAPGEDGLPIPSPEVVQQHNDMAAQFREDLKARLAKSPHKDVLVYVHGYNNDFDYTVSVVAEIWHFLGRRGVPLVYTWPAGRGGLRGYFYDRESGEFTIYHLKQLLKVLGNCEEIENIHLVAHSRGTDVTVTALRELYLEIGVENLRPREERKLRNLVLAAPDLDIDVIAQRISAEDFMREIDRVTLYMSTTDAALGMSTWLFVSRARVGRLTSVEGLPNALKNRARDVNLAESPARMNLVDARVNTGFIGHSYFYSHPAVSSDLIMMLRDDLDPGPGGRPMESLGSIFWRVGNNYPPKGSYAPADLKPEK